MTNLFGNKTKEEYLSGLYRARQKKIKYYLIKKNVTYTELQRLKTFPIFKYGKYKGGFIIAENKKRIRPFGILASRTIGYILNDGIAIGMEAAYDEQLRGSDKIILKRKVGKHWVPVDIIDNLNYETGGDIISTININFQDFAHKVLLKH